MLFPNTRSRVAGLILCASAAITSGYAQNTSGWLRYAIPPDPPRYHALPHAVVVLGTNGQAAPEEEMAADELDRGLGHMVAGTDVVLHRFDPRLDAIVLGTTDALHRAHIGRSLPGWTEKPLPEEGFRIVHLRRGVREWYILQGGSPRAELWAAFRFAALVAEDQQLPEDFTDTPQMPLRALDMGLAADALPLLEGTTPRTSFARLLASVGLNGIFVSANTTEAVRVAGAVRPYGIRVWVRSDNSSPDATDRLATTVPNFGGVLVESAVHGSLQQLRSTALEANGLAKSLRHTGASVILQDALGAPLREATTTVRAGDDLSPEACAAVLRGMLEPNVVLAGTATPLPLSGLGSANFGLLPGTAQLAAFDLLARRPDTLAYPAAAWRKLLETPERGLHGDTTLTALLTTGVDNGAHGGIAGRLSAEQARQMLQQPFLLANLYAFGRLAWSPTLKVEAVTDEWSRQTWGDDARVHGTATRILLDSFEAARNNSTPLGLPLLASETGAPNPSAALHLVAEGTALATPMGVGLDRTARGTGEVERYPFAFAAMLADPDRCPMPWLLLFHRLLYSAALPNGRTLTQNFYDAHYAGAAQAGNAVDAWESTRGLVDEPRFRTVDAFLARAAVHAEVWRETTTEWMQQTSGLRDTLGFVGSHTGRVDADHLQSSNYLATPSAPGGSRRICKGGDCTAATTFQGGANVYRVEVGYLDEHLGATYELRVNGESRAQWRESADNLPAEPERFVVNGVRLKDGDTVAVHASTVGKATAPLDFIEITRDPRWN